MAKISFNVTINGKVIEAYIKLEGQQLYFFEQGSDLEKKNWIKSSLKDMMKIENIEINK